MSATDEVMEQTAPYPSELKALVDALRYKHGWYFTLASRDRGQGSEGLTLDITTLTTNSYHPTVCEFCSSAVTGYRVHHYFIVPAAAYDMRSWRRWLFDQVVLVERHEAAEFFKIDNDRPYAPSHGPGNDPYLIREVGTDLDARTSFRGEVAQ